MINHWFGGLRPEKEMPAIPAPPCIGFSAGLSIRESRRSIQVLEEFIYALR